MKNIFVEYINSIVKEFFIESTFRLKANFRFWRQSKRKWLCNQLFDEKIVLHCRQKINVDVTKWANDFFFLVIWIVIIQFLRVKCFVCTILIVKNFFNLNCIRLNFFIYHVCFVFIITILVEFFFLSKISNVLVLDFDTSSSNRTRFRKSNAKIFFVKKTTKQIEHFFRRKTNINIFDFDKQNFNIDKKYNRKTINKKIEKTRNRWR